MAGDFCINLAEVTQQQQQQQQPQPQQDQVKVIEDRKFIESVKHLYKLHKAGGEGPEERERRSERKGVGQGERLEKAGRIGGQKSRQRREVNSHMCPCAFLHYYLRL